MRTIPVLVAAAILLAAPAESHEGQPGAPCHMGKTVKPTGTVVYQRHCHGTRDVERDEATERHRKKLCEKRLVKLRYAIGNLESRYAKRQLEKKCAVRDKPLAVDKLICDRARKQYQVNLAAKKAHVERRRADVAKVCKPGENSVRKVIVVAAAVFLLAAPAKAHFPSECASALNFVSVDGLETQKWKSESVSSKTKELLAKSDLVRLRSWAAHVDANQQYLAQTMIPALQKLLKCIAANGRP